MTGDPLSDDAEIGADLQQVAASFGGYRAEQLEDQGRLYRLFSAPSFMAELETNRSCLLVGGRGTGKTTLLKGLTLKGQMELLNQPEEALQFIGVYVRINSNRVAAFAGSELEQSRWNQVFGHYINLLLIDELLRTVLVLESTNASDTISSEGLDLTCMALHLPSCQDLSELHSAVRRSLVQLEAAVNNVGEGMKVPLSLQGQPIDVLVEYLGKGPILGERLLFFLIDEYENLSEPQQTVFNTLVKHARSDYSFKIGIKSLGLKTRGTLSTSEMLSCPADYEQIDIVERLEAEGFQTFASRVVELRLRSFANNVAEHAPASTIPPSDWLRPVSMESEAVMLGVEIHLSELSRAVRNQLNDVEFASFEALGALDRYAFIHLASDDIVMAIRQALKDPVAWARRVDNHRYAMLFSIRRGRVGIKKYYAGWPTICALSGGNIRYLLQIVNEIALTHLRSGRALTMPVSAEVQTKAAQEIGYRNLCDLEGIARDGAKLARLLLGLGRIFGVMASRPEGHAPEVNQIVMSERSDEHTLKKASDLLQSAVQHQALVDFAGNKLARESGETRASNYMMHPIYSAFFVYSHRKQRKMRLTADELLGLVDRSRETIHKVLAKTGREQYLESDDVQAQLALFSEYYGLSEST